jgi:HPt (histidine-containing phosphotransfer) domain-containing protein
MNAHLTKPIDIDKLVALLNQWFNDNESESIENSVLLQKITTLPEFLPPFDLVAALAICNQNSMLLHKLLVNFNANYREMANQLTTFIEEKAFIEAKHLTHSMNGIAGTLGAHELKNAAAALELALHLGEIDNIDSLLSDFVVKFTDAIHATASLSALEKSIIRSNLDEDDVNERFKQFKYAVSFNQFKAIDIFNELRPHFLQCNEQKIVDELEEYLEKLNFNHALHIIESMTISRNDVTDN